MTTTPAGVSTGSVRRSVTATTVAVIGALAVSTVVADEVVLSNGGRVLGKAFREPGFVRVEVEGGSMTFPESSVVEIIEGLSPMELREIERRDRARKLAARLTATDRFDAQALYGIVVESRREGYPEEELTALLGLVLGADPDHAGARRDLGQVLFRERWMPTAEATKLERRDYDDRMRARGFVLWGGEWITPTEETWRSLEEEWLREIRSARSERDDAIADAERARGEIADLENAVAAARSDADTYAAAAQKAEAEAEHYRCEAADAQSALSACESRLSSCESNLSSCE